MKSKPGKESAPEKRPREVIHIVRGNDRNMWDKPPGQRPDRLNPPVYEQS
jgi:hypothetical protein